MTTEEEPIVSSSSSSAKEEENDEKQQQQDQEEEEQQQQQQQQQGVGGDGGVSLHELKKVSHAYILDKEDSWIPCQVVEQNSSTGEVVVSIPEYKDQQSIKCDAGRTAKRKNRKTVLLKDYPNQALPLQNVDEDGRLKQVEDMVDLPFLHEVRFFFFSM